MTTATELRALALKLADVCRESHCHSIAWPIIVIACEHLTAIARIHEQNAAALSGGDEMTKIKLCNCGSGIERFMLKDGHGIFLTYACDKCKEEKLSHFRPDIMEKYKCDEPIDEE
jgi:hypothetical protein